MTKRVKEHMTTEPVVVESTEPLARVAEMMRDRDIGDVLVQRENEFWGIVTDRDIVVRAVADGRHPASVTAGEVCTAQGLRTVSPEDDARTAFSEMRERELRRIPVVDDGRPVGILSITDLAVG